MWLISARRIQLHDHSMQYPDGGRITVWLHASYPTALPGAASTAPSIMQPGPQKSALTLILASEL